MDLAPGSSAVRGPFAALGIPADPAVPRRIVNTVAQVTLVLVASRRAEIGPAIVGPVAVDVVYTVFWKGPTHVEKRKSVRLIDPLVELDLHVSGRVLGPSDRPGRGIGASSD